MAAAPTGDTTGGGCLDVSTVATRVILVLAGALLLQTSAPLLAASNDWCEGRVEASLAKLASSLGELDVAREAPLRAELLAVCQESQARNAETAGSQASSAAPGAAGEESSTILGVEIRRAPEGADGYDRVRK
jgi:hypothetical protein